MFWAYILAGCRYLAKFFQEYELQIFHCAIVLVLWVVDFAISLILNQRYSTKVALCFILFPTSLLLNGYHCQMDNCAVLLAYISWIILEQSPKRWQLSAVLLACSLIQKHIFMFFPLWIFINKELLDYKIKLFYCSIVYSLFLISFLPFCNSITTVFNIYTNVFAYDSANGVALLPYISKQFLSNNTYQQVLQQDIFKYIFIISIVVIGFLLKNKRQLLFYGYCVAVVACSSALVNQYLIIPIVALSLRYSRLTLLYAIASTLFLTLRSNSNIGSTQILQELLLQLPCQTLITVICSLYFCQALLIIYLYLLITQTEILNTQT